MRTMSIVFIGKPTFQIGTSVQFGIIVLKVENLHSLKGFKTLRFTHCVIIIIRTVDASTPS